MAVSLSWQLRNIALSKRRTDARVRQVFLAFAHSSPALDRLAKGRVLKAVW
jgi:hypothetical protein